MKAALFCTSRYIGDAPQGVWPVPNEYCNPELAEQSMAVTMEQFRLADVFGFDWVTVAEHHFSSLSLTPNPMIFAGALSQVVKRAKIAVLGPSLPTLNPVRVAEEFAMLDAMTGGRLIAGLMRGTPNEYVTYNFNPSESRARFAEALEIIRRAWTEPQPFGWQGRYYQYRSISIWPRPVQRPHPPIYISGSSPEAGEFAAEQHIGLGFAFTTIAQAAKASAYYQVQCREQGWEAKSDDIIYRVGFHVAETDEEAFDDMSKAPQRVALTTANASINKAMAETAYYGRDESQVTRTATRTLQDRIDSGQLLVGSPQTIARQIERIHKEIGAGILDCPLAAQLGDKTLRSIELFGTKVLPRIREPLIMTSENLGSDTVLWLGEKCAALRDLVAAKFRVIDKAPSGGERFGVIAESDAAAAALALALDRPEEVTALILIGPRLIHIDGRAADEALVARLGGLKVPLLALFGTKDQAAPTEAGRHYRERLANCNVVFVYDAGAAMADERPEAVAELALDFLHRGDTFLVRQTSDLLYR